MTSSSVYQLQLDSVLLNYPGEGPLNAVRKDQLTEAIVSINNALLQEENARIAEDVRLQGAIETAVAQLVGGAPELLNTLNELAAAIGDDESFTNTMLTKFGEISAALDNETLARTAAVEAAVAALNSTITTQVGLLEAQIQAEETRATGAEQANTDAIVAEVTRATAAEGVLQGNIDVVKDNLLTEVKRAVGAEQANTDAIEAEEQRALAAEVVLQRNIDDEEIRATAAELVNKTSILDEVTRATAAEAVLQSKIQDEKTRALTAEDALQTQITNFDTNKINRGGDINISGDYQFNGKVEAAVFKIGSKWQYKEVLMDGVMALVLEHYDQNANDGAGGWVVVMPFKPVLRAGWPVPIGSYKWATGPFSFFLDMTELFNPLTNAVWNAATAFDTKTTNDAGETVSVLTLPSSGEPAISYDAWALDQATVIAPDLYGSPAPDTVNVKSAQFNFPDGVYQKYVLIHHNTPKGCIYYDGREIAINQAFNWELRFVPSGGTAGDIEYNPTTVLVGTAISSTTNDFVALATNYGAQTQPKVVAYLPGGSVSDRPPSSIMENDIVGSPVVNLTNDLNTGFDWLSTKVTLP
jgi:hypothetical protein